MKVLWITNILFPDIAEYLKLPKHVTGGWMLASVQAIMSVDEKIEIGVAAMYGGDTLIIKKINLITYYCLPFPENLKKYNNKLEVFWKQIDKDFCPNVVHIQGTEFAHGLAYVNACGSNKVLISIQGLVSVYARYSLGLIDKFTLLYSITLYDLLKSSILNLPKAMASQGKLEIEYIKKCNNIIGRTDWDRAHSWAINPQIKYHFCNETLRQPFYNSTWKLNECQRYSILLSQAYMPIKGLHKLIEALPLVLKFFPETKIYVTGIDFLKRTSLKDKLKFTSYANYIRKIIKNHNLESYFFFLGLLDADKMVASFLNSHIFVCPSSIENSPNSLGEAQLLGVPSVGAYVGGVPCMIEDNVSGLLYRFEEYEMLAYNICRIFSDDALALKLSEGGRSSALNRHDRLHNANNTISIYNQIISEKNEI